MDPEWIFVLPKMTAACNGNTIRIQYVIEKNENTNGHGISTWAVICDGNPRIGQKFLKIRKEIPPRGGVKLPILPVCGICQDRQ